MKTAGRIASLLLAFPAWIFAQAPPTGTEGFAPFVREQLQRAEQEASLHPDDPAKIGTLAMTLHAYQRYEAAARAYSRASVLEPRNFAWPYLLGIVDMDLGEFDRALQRFRSALLLRPDDLAAQIRLGHALASRASWRDAAAAYRRALESHPDSPQAWYGLGRTQSAQGDHAEAARSLAKACDLFPDYGAAHFALASELRRTTRSEGAAEQLRAYSRHQADEPPLPDPLLRSVEALNQSALTHLQRGMQMEAAGNVNEAIREHLLALEIDPANVQAHVNLISLYGRTGDVEKAKEQFDAATRLDSGRSDAWYNYGVLRFGVHDYAGAEQAFHRALAINPADAEAHNNLGAILEQQAQLDAAAAEFRLAIANRPDYPLARFHLARILVHSGNYTEAIQQLRRTLQPEDDQTPTYLYALGAAYARSGNRQDAITYYQKAHAAAAAHGQSQLLASINRDLSALETAP